MGNPEKILDYLSRYVFRIAITDRRILEKIAKPAYRLKLNRLMLNGRSMPGGKPKTSLKTTNLCQTWANGQKQRWELPEKVSQKHSIPIM